MTGVIFFQKRKVAMEVGLSGHDNLKYDETMTKLPQTGERLIAEQTARNDALKALVRATREIDNNGDQLVAIMFAAVAEVCNAVFDLEDDDRLAEDFSDILSAVRHSRATLSRCAPAARPRAVEEPDGCLGVRGQSRPSARLRLLRG